MAKNLMIQGTMSNAGKSIVTAGILRVLKQDGYKVAPFKSQNMALNSYVTKDGFEMGRAQVMQAEAAGIEPDVCMNPILLKPTSDVGSQVIVNGIPLKNMPAKEYFKYKKKLVPDIMKAYDTLDKTYDVIVLEGAGSPAEINLKKDDIVNMGMAKMVDAPVLLVGDIDRGGVFAQLVGTIVLLEEEERKRVKGFVMNKFRGDPKILEPGFKQLYDICHIPVTGVIPYIRLDIDDEDSLSERIDTSFKSLDGDMKTLNQQLDIVVIRLPHISNFTDFNALERMDIVNLRYVDKAEQIGRPDLIILPGSKNTINDLKWMRHNHIEAQLIKCSRQEIPLFGICGGYQMLGDVIDDSCKAETGEVVPGIGLLPVITTFAPGKHTTRVKGVICEQTGMWKELAGSACSGYEIHMGESVINTDTAVSDTVYMDESSNSIHDYDDTHRVTAFAAIHNMTDGTEYMDGCVCGNVAGTYLHGIFDMQQFGDRFIDMLCKRKGISRNNCRHISYNQYKQKEYDKLADVIRANMDMEYIYKIMGLV